VGPRTDLDDVEMRKFLNLPGLEFRPLCRPHVYAVINDCVGYVLNVTPCIMGIMGIVPT
jgi:hypothetical protein